MCSNKLHKQRRARRGFTLVEMMVVIVIIGLLAGAVTISVRTYLIRGKQSVARMEIAKICQALDTYYTVHDRFPPATKGSKCCWRKTTISRMVCSTSFPKIPGRIPTFTCSPEGKHLTKCSAMERISRKVAREQIAIFPAWNSMKARRAERKLAFRVTSCGAFTLLELLLVLIVLSMVAVTVAVAWSGLHRRAVMADAIQRIEFFDQHMRQYARMHRSPCALKFDTKEGRVRKIYDLQGDKGTHWHTLGRGITLKQIEVSGGGRMRSTVEIPFNRHGLSATYGIALETRGEAQRWLVVAGLSGQVTHFETEDEFDAALQLIEPQGI